MGPIFFGAPSVSTNFDGNVPDSLATGEVSKDSAARIIGELHGITVSIGNSLERPTDVKGENGAAGSPAECQEARGKVLRTP
jgi:hypothetical protein